MSPKGRVLGVLLIVALLFVACRPVQAPPDRDTSVALMEQYADAWSEGGPDVLDGAPSENFTVHHQEFPDVTTTKALKQFITFVHNYAPDFRQTLVDAVADGNWVVGRGVLDVTPPETKGGPVSYGVINMIRIDGGRIAELWMFSDEFSVNRYYYEIPDPENRLVFPWGDDSAAAGATGSREENMALVRQWLEGDDAARAALAADPYVFHSTMYPELNTLKDRAEIMAELRTAFPDLALSLQEPMLAEGDRVAVPFTMNGTNTGPFLDREASNKTLEWLGIAIYRVVDGKIADEWVLWSGYYVYSQIRGW